MSRQERNEREVRAILESTQPVVPAEIHTEAVRRGGRTLRRRRVLRLLLRLALCAAVVAFFVWAMVARPWAEPPSQTTPPLTGW